MLKEAQNNVRIEGILSEIELKYGSFQKNLPNGAKEEMRSVGGVIKVQVKQLVDGEETVLEVPVHMFASEFTNRGGLNPAYESIERVMTEFTSIAAAGGAVNADSVRITNGKVTMNEYYSRDGKLISFPRITASFVNRIRPDEMQPEASFATTFVVAKKERETDKEGIETGRFKITGILPQYGGKVDVVDFFTTNPKVISAVDQYWNENDTVSAVGRLNFSSRTETITKEVDFGEALESTRTISVSELIVTGGTSAPLDGELAYDMTDIQNALVKRKDALEKQKAKAASGTTAAPAQGAKTDLGF